MSHIVILGAGYAGLRAALDLDTLLASQPTSARVTLVERNPYHQIIQLLHQAAADAIPPEDTIVALSRLLRERPRVTLHEAEALALDPASRTVRTLAGDVRYDRLVLALGAAPDFGGVPGAREHTLPLRTYADALRVRDHVRACFERAAVEPDAAARRPLLTFAIVGGGYTGCQLAGELAARACELCRQHGLARSEVRVALLQRGAQLLEQLGAWATAEAERALGAAGVSVHLNTPAATVEDGLLRLGGVGAGKVLRAATIIWAGGFRAPALLAEAGLPHDERGRARVDGHLRVEGNPDVYACGDCARVPAANGETVPATASYALRQGEYLAPQLLADLRGEESATYEPLMLGELVSLGPRYAVGNALGARVTGSPAMLLKKGVEQWYRGMIGA
jgi:NADH dehydrogenase